MDRVGAFFSFCTLPTGPARVHAGAAAAIQQQQQQQQRQQRRRGRDRQRHQWQICNDFSGSIQQHQFRSICSSDAFIPSARHQLSQQNASASQWIFVSSAGQPRQPRQPWQSVTVRVGSCNVMFCVVSVSLVFDQCQLLDQMHQSMVNFQISSCIS